MQSIKQKLATTMMLIVVAVWRIFPAPAQGTVVAEAVPSNATPSFGATITVDINIDVSGTNPAQLLGSFTGTLQWNPEVLRYVSHSNIKAPFTGVVNTNVALSGRLTFNGANINGAAGKPNVLTVTYTVVGGNGATTALDLSFTDMLAAATFVNLMPILTIRDGSIRTAVREGNHAAALPKDFALGQNFPNPFSSS